MRSLENPTNKLLWGSFQSIQKRVDGQRLATQFWKKLLLEAKLTERKAAIRLLKQNNKEEKEKKSAISLPKENYGKGHAC